MANDENLIPMNRRTKSEQRKIATAGGKASGAARRKKRQKEQDEREQAREKGELCIINCINASLALGEATAKAVQRIPDAKCNGDMHAALDYAQKVKHEQKDFLNSQALHQLY